MYLYITVNCFSGCRRWVAPCPLVILVLWQEAYIRDLIYSLTSKAVYFALTPYNYFWPFHVSITAVMKGVSQQYDDKTTHHQS